MDYVDGPPCPGCGKITRRMLNPRTGRPYTQRRRVEEDCEDCNAVAKGARAIRRYFDSPRPNLFSGD